MYIFHRAWLTTALLAPALALAGCSVYVGDDAPQTPLPVPPPQWPDGGGWPDASPPPWPDAAPPPSRVEVSIPLRESLAAQARYVEITRLSQYDAPTHQILPMSGNEDQVTVASWGADLLAVSVHQASGQLLDATLVGTRCPSLATPNRILEVPAQYPSIQQAIDEAAPGDIVYVHPGTYRENIELRWGIRLIGAGASRTILDGEGRGDNLIDFSGATNVMIRGFTLRNVGQGEGCADPDDPFRCAGDWYAAAIYADGHALEQGPGCPGASAVITHNVIEGNQLGVMLYYFAPAVIRNNLFVGNINALAVNHLNDSSLVVNNTFAQNEDTAIADQYGHLDLFNNIIAGSPMGLRYEGEEATWNDLGCNIFFEVGNPGDYVVLSEGNNEALDPGFRDAASDDYRLRADSPVLGHDCFAQPDQGITTAPGAYGGLAGAWYDQPIERDDLAATFGL